MTRKANGSCCSTSQKAARTKEKSTMKQAEELTWEQLTELEPRLQALLAEVETQGATNYKRRMEELVGFYAQHPDPRMRTVAAHTVAYDRLYQAAAARWLRRKQR
jgi:hypothetical protein